MPSTQYNISMIKTAVQNYSRQQILDVLNEVQQIVYSENTMQVAKIDPATGMPPYLETVAGQRFYECPADCRETTAIFWERPNRGYSPSQNRGLYTEYIYRNARFYQTAITSNNALVDVLANLTFIDDPGDTTTQYFHEYTMKPVSLTAESVQLVIPEELHYLMRKAVIAMLSVENYGETGYDEVVIEKIAKKIRRKLNKGAQAKPGITPYREEYMDGDSPNSFNY